MTDKDPRWIQSDGLAWYERACLEVSPECPSEVVFILQNAMSKGWITQSVYVPEKTLMWETLGGSK